MWADFVCGSVRLWADLRSLAHIVFVRLCCFGLILVSLQIFGQLSVASGSFVQLLGGLLALGCSGSFAPLWVVLHSFHRSLSHLSGFLLIFMALYDLIASFVLSLLPVSVSWWIWVDLFRIMWLFVAS